MGGGAGGGDGGGREGDWDCGGCGNRNYAFRCFCNRCKQHRLLVDAKTPADSKWLPRIGDWICTGCTNNNYASREKCKKCGQPKEVAAMPASAIPGASLATHPTYFARGSGGVEQSIGLFGSGAPGQTLPLSSNWSLGGTNKYGFHPATTWPVGVTHSTGMGRTAPTSQLVSTQNGWRSGDWICSCGFHNYSSRSQCKKCNAAIPPAAPPFLSPTSTALGTKRLAPDEFVYGWDNKRLNAGQAPGLLDSYSGAETIGLSNFNNPSVKYSSYLSGRSSLAPNLQVNLQMPAAAAPTLLGKGAKQWRDGDWMCVKCNNHNYASRSECNRCKTQKEVLPQSVSVT